MDTSRPGRQRLSRTQRAGLLAAVFIALSLACYGAAGSYETISELATRAGVPLPDLVPLGIDGGLVGVVILDLVLSWTEDPVGWLRQLARVLTFGTVAANVSAGWPAPVAVGLHAAAPLMLLVMVEAGRAVLLRRAGLAAGTARDRIPLARWLLAPWRTYLLWRCMVLWQITDYERALNMEISLHRARIRLRSHYGPRWRTAAPADLVWTLHTAPFAEEACATVEELTNQPPLSPHATSSRTDGVSDVLGLAAKINERHWAQHGRPAAADTIRKELHIGSQLARQLARTVRSMHHGDHGSITAPDQAQAPNVAQSLPTTRSAPPDPPPTAGSPEESRYEPFSSSRPVSRHSTDRRTGHSNTGHKS